MKIEQIRLSYTWKFFFLLGIFITSGLHAAGAKTPVTINDWVMLVFGLSGGLALFLYGMEKMSQGMKKSAGSKMRSILAALTNNKLIGLSVGAFVTMIIQSSSATTVMLVSFVQSGLMSFTQSLGVILGADIGTTVTAQLIAFKFTDYAMLMIAIGFAMTIISKKESTKHIGEAVLGFGILFFGMKFMGDTMKPLKEIESFRHFLLNVNPLLAILTATIFTAVIQSSSAFTGIIIILAQQGLINLETGIPLIFGANIGTCITAGLASIGTGREAKRVALAHVIFKIGGVLLFFFWIPQFALMIETISLKLGIGSIARQIANAHTIFNVGMAFIFLPFTSYFANFILKLLPDEEEEQGIVLSVWHLEESALNVPATAIDLARAEILRMTKIVGRMNAAVVIPLLNSGEQRDDIYPQLSLIEGIEMRENKINYLDEKVNDFLIHIGKKEITSHQISEIYALMSIINDLENIGDVISKNLVKLIYKKRALKLDFSEAGKQELATYHVKISKQISRVKNAFSEKDKYKAKAIITKSEEYNNLELDCIQKHLKRVSTAKSNSMETHEVHMGLMDGLKLINIYSENIAKTIIEYVK